MRRAYFSLVGVILVAAVTALGCGADETASQVTGKVTFDDQPIENGTISFFPVDGKTKTTGGPINAGSYSVRVPVGTMWVRISMPKVVGKKKLYDEPNSPERSLYAEGLPPRYNQETELKLEVTPGGVQKDWELTSK